MDNVYTGMFGEQMGACDDCGGLFGHDVDCPRNIQSAYSSSADGQKKKKKKKKKKR